jgi:hypothetical protein
VLFWNFDDCAYFWYISLTFKTSPVALVGKGTQRFKTSATETLFFFIFRAEESAFEQKVT